MSAEGFHVAQTNQGFSKRAGTLRGLHFQEGDHAQAKLVSCLHGSIFNVAVDLRLGDTFGYAYGEFLSFENQKQMLIPRGFSSVGNLPLSDVYVTDFPALSFFKVNSTFLFFTQTL